MKKLLRVVTCLFLSISLNSFAAIDAKRLQLSTSSYSIPNPDYDGPYSFFDPNGVDEFLSVTYIDGYSNAYSFSTSIESDIYYQGDIKLVDIFSAGYADINSTWGWTEEMAALKINSCVNSSSWCNSSFNSPGLKEADILVNDGQTFYALGYYYSHRQDYIFDLMVGEPIDRVAFLNDYFGYVTPEEYYASEVPLPAGVWLFGSALAGLVVVRRKK